jgi:hypothetical protein
LRQAVGAARVRPGGHALGRAAAESARGGGVAAALAELILVSRFVSGGFRKGAITRFLLLTLVVIPGVTPLIPLGE